MWEIARVKAVARWLLVAAAPLACFGIVRRQVDGFCRVVAPFERLTGRRIDAAGDGIGELLGGRGLRRLDLSGSALTDAELLGLQADLEALPALDRLLLGRTLVLASGLAALENLRELRSLDLRQSPISDGGLERLRPLSGLTHLGLSGTRITDAGIEHLERLENLQVLWLGQTNVTDACIPRLCRLKRLEVLSLEHTRITDAGLRLLQEALPDCEIIY